LDLAWGAGALVCVLAVPLGPEERDWSALEAEGDEESGAVEEQSGDDNVA